MEELDKTDRRLLFYLDRNSRCHLTALAKMVGLSKESTHYRINRLLKNGYITKFYTIINTAKAGYYFFKVYVQLQDMTEESEKSLLAWLQSHPRYGWSCFCSGRWDVIVGIWATDPLDFDTSFLREFLGRFGMHILTREVSISKHNIQQSRKWFYTDDLDSITADVGGSAESGVIDEMDLEILKIIANNARMKTTRIAQLAKTTPAVVQHRLKNMENNGVILAYRISFDLSTYGYEFCKAFVYLKDVETKRLNQLLECCKQHSNILNTVTTFGGWDLELEFEVPNFQYFHAAMKEIRNRFNDVIKSYDAVLISKEYKVDFIPGSYGPITETTPINEQLPEIGYVVYSTPRKRKRTQADQRDEQPLRTATL